MSCDEPVALFMRESIIVRLIWQLWTLCALYKRSELYCGYLTTAYLFVFVFFLYFVVRIRCRRKKFTFAISSADEFLVESWLIDYKSMSEFTTYWARSKSARVFFFHSACLMSVCSGPAGRRIPNGILCWCSGIVLYLRR